MTATSPAVESASGFPRMVGRSAAIRTLEGEIDLAARSDANVLMTGETGVGQDVVARLIHGRSPRAKAPLATVSCAGLPDSLLESELFGHERGSFTGAYCDKPGLLETANNGTLFLGAFSEMSARLQMILRRFLDTAEIRRVGATRAHARVNVRLVAATTRDLSARIAAGTFCKHLYSQLNVVRLTIPPLRERSEDIPLLVTFFLHAFARQRAAPAVAVSADAMAALVAYPWPGNVNELKHIVGRISLRATGPSVGSDDLPTEVSRSSRTTPGAEASREHA